MNTLQICPPHLSDVATLPWEIQKSFSTLLFIYVRLFKLLQKKTNSICCIAALAVHLLLFGASYYLHSPSTASGARYRRSSCVDVAACSSGLLRHGQNFSTAWCSMRLISVERLEECINPEGGHSEHLLWHCLPDSPVVTHHNRFFSEPPTTTHNWLSSEPPTFERTQRTSARWKRFAIHKLVWWHFQVAWASGLQFDFFWDNIDNQKDAWIILLKINFLDFPR